MKYYFNTFEVSRIEFKELYRTRTTRGVDTQLNKLWKQLKKEGSIKYIASTNYVFEIKGERK